MTPGPSPSWQSSWRATLAEYAGLLAVLLLLVAYFSLRSQYFLTPGTFASIANAIPDLLVVSVAMTLVLITGGIDLSVGSVMALSASVMAVAVTRWGLPWWLGLLLCLATGLACGLVNGAVTVAWTVPSFIVTLGMQEAARGLAYMAAGSQTIYLGSRIEAAGAPIRGLGVSPAFLVALAITAVAQVILARTVFGRKLVAVGTNEEAVRLSGLDPRPTKVAVFALAGLLSGLAGWFSSAKLGAADPNGANGMELAAIAAAVIGGTSLMGGRGSVANTFLGVLLIAALQTGLSQTGTTDPAKRVITGVVIVLAVIADAYRARHTGRLGRWLGRLTGRA